MAAMLERSSTFHIEHEPTSNSLQLRSIARRTKAVFGLNQTVSGSSLDIVKREARARFSMARASGSKEGASLVGRSRALATTTIIGFRSKPIAGSPKREATAVVVPLPFQGSFIRKPGLTKDEVSSEWTKDSGKPA
jgi:hypothetical protein